MCVLQDQINRTLATGGGVVSLGPGTYSLSAPLILNRGASNVDLIIRGAGVFATKIIQTNATSDIFQLGVTSADVGEHLVLSDLGLSGGRYALNFNNCLSCIVERLRIENAQVGLYFQGQNENHTIRNVLISGMAQHAILAGVANGGTGSVLDYPELQKCLFHKIRVAGTSGGTAILITAGVIGTTQVLSGHNTFSEILCESNRRGTMAFHHCFDTRVDALSIEEQLDADNVYTSLLIDDGSTVYARHLNLSRPARPFMFKYYVDVPSGHLSVTESIIGGDPSTRVDIRVNDNVTMTDTYLGSAASVQFTTPRARANSLFALLRDTSGQPLTIP